MPDNPDRVPDELDMTAPEAEQVLTFPADATLAVVTPDPELFADVCQHILSPEFAAVEHRFNEAMRQQNAKAPISASALDCVCWAINQISMYLPLSLDDPRGAVDLMAAAASLIAMRAQRFHEVFADPEKFRKECEARRAEMALDAMSSMSPDKMGQA